MRTPNAWNRKSIATLIDGDEGALVRNRLRVLAPSEDLAALIHAKIILVDHRHGYLGSANLSQSAMDSNLEVGLSLDPNQVTTLESLISVLEARSLICDYTALVSA